MLRQPNLREPGADELRLLIEGRASGRFAPLERITINGSIADSGYLKIIDGGGAEYGTTPVRGIFEFQFMVGGELGWHRIRLESEEGELRSEQRFWVDAKTEMDLEPGPVLRLWRSLHGSVLRSQRSVLIDGKVVPFFIRWVRDDTHVQKASVYWAPETGAWMERFIERQAANGMIFDYACRLDKAPERPAVFGEAFSMTDQRNKVRWERLPSEADVEYLLVENVFRSWQASGDDARMKRLLPSLEKALGYCMEDGLRWAKDQQLVKRPYTIDTWDFKFFGFDRGHLEDSAALQDAVFNVHPDTPMCVMHGDNSGMYQACSQLSRMFAAVGEEERARLWSGHAEHFKRRTNALCWNGEYYNHWVPVTPLEMDQGGVDGSKSFTLSNAYNLNRGIADHQQCVSIIRKYQSLREELRETHVAEWLAAHPCWPKGFSGVKPGTYVNGGILTIVAGELARGAFSHGFERYGADILQRLASMLMDNHEDAARDPELFVQPYLYCGYTPEGERVDGIPDAWGQAAVVAAFVGGLAGVVDRDRGMRSAEVSPRWVAMDVEQAGVVIRYPASDGYVAYQYELALKESEVRLAITGNALDWKIRILLPGGFEPADMQIDGRSIPFVAESVENSVYAVVDWSGKLVSTLVVKLSPKTS